MENNNTIKNLIKELGNWNKLNREKAFRKLVKAGDSNTVQLLIRL